MAVETENEMRPIWQQRIQQLWFSKFPDWQMMQWCAVDAVWRSNSLLAYTYSALGCVGAKMSNNPASPIISLRAVFQILGKTWFSFPGGRETKAGFNRGVILTFFWDTFSSGIRSEPKLIKGYWFNFYLLLNYPLIILWYTIGIIFSYYCFLSEFFLLFCFFLKCFFCVYFISDDALYKALWTAFLLVVVHLCILVMLLAILFNG